MEIRVGNKENLTLDERTVARDGLDGAFGGLTMARAGSGR